MADKEDPPRDADAADEEGGSGSGSEESGDEEHVCEEEGPKIPVTVRGPGALPVAWRACRRPGRARARGRGRASLARACVCVWGGGILLGRFFLLRMSLGTPPGRRAVSLVPSLSRSSSPLPR